MTIDLELSLIRTDGGTQMRADLDRDTYMDYRDKWIAGVRFDPVDVFHDGSAYWLADGFHRFYGAREAKRRTIPANIRQGTVRDAILFACGANTSHGLRRTNADKRRAVETLLNDEEWVSWSDRQIAEKAGVSPNFVGDVRRQLSSDDSSQGEMPEPARRRGRDGRRRKAPSRIKLTVSNSNGADGSKATPPSPSSRNGNSNVVSPPFDGAAIAKQLGATTRDVDAMAGAVGLANSADHRKVIGLLDIAFEGIQEFAKACEAEFWRAKR